MTELFTKKEVADILRVRPETVEYLHKSRQLRGIIIARKLRFTKSAVDEYIRNCQESS